MHQGILYFFSLYSKGKRSGQYAAPVQADIFSLPCAVRAAHFFFKGRQTVQGDSSVSADIILLCRISSVHSHFRAGKPFVLPAFYQSCADTMHRAVSPDGRFPYRAQSAVLRLEIIASIYCAVSRSHSSPARNPRIMALQDRRNSAVHSCLLLCCGGTRIP